MSTPGNTDPEDLGTSQADSPPGGGRGGGFTWLFGLLGVAAVILVVVLILGSLDR